MKVSSTRSAPRQLVVPFIQQLFLLLRPLLLISCVVSMLRYGLLLFTARWRRFKDALFYEMMLLLLQPNPVVLFLLWPGWVAVGGLWWYWSSVGRGDVNVSAGEGG